MKEESFPDLIGFGDGRLDKAFRPDVMLHELKKSDVYMAPFLRGREGLYEKLLEESTHYHFKRVKGVNSTQGHERFFLAAPSKLGDWHDVVAASVYDWLSAGLRELGHEEWPVPWTSREVQVSRPDFRSNGDVVLDRRRHKNFAVILVMEGTVRMIVTFDSGETSELDLLAGDLFVTGFNGCHTNRTITRVDVKRCSDDYELFTIRQRIPRSDADN